LYQLILFGSIQAHKGPPGHIRTARTGGDIRERRLPVGHHASIIILMTITSCSRQPPDRIGNAAGIRVILHEAVHRIQLDPISYKETIPDSRIRIHRKADIGKEMDESIIIGGVKVSFTISCGEGRGAAEIIIPIKAGPAHIRNEILQTIVFRMIAQQGFRPGRFEIIDKILSAQVIGPHRRPVDIHRIQFAILIPVLYAGQLVSGNKSVSKNGYPITRRVKYRPWIDIGRIGILAERWRHILLHLTGKLIYFIDLFRAEQVTVGYLSAIFILYRRFHTAGDGRRAPPILLDEAAPENGIAAQSGKTGPTIGDPAARMGELETVDIGVYKVDLRLAQVVLQEKGIPVIGKGSLVDG
jgi:hypothetical protein